MKKHLSIALLSFFLLHLAGFYVYFGIRQSQIHREMRSKLKTLPADLLEIFHLAPSAYQHALRDDDEIQLNEKMYDIARIEIRENQIVVYALHDSAEDKLLSFLDQVLKTSTQDSQQAPSSLFQFNFLSFILPADFRVDDSSIWISRPFTSYVNADISFVTSIDTPPPRA